MKILFFIESLYSGGKERRLVELLTGLKQYKNIKCELVLTRTDIHYKDIYNLNIPIHIIERQNFKKDPRLFIKFYKICRKIKPDLVHVWGNLAAIYSIPSKLFLRIPVINNQIADAPQSLPKGILSYKLTFPFSDRLIANSKAGLNAYKPPLKKSFVIYNGFNFERTKNLRDSTEIKRDFKISSDFVVGMIASFSKKKDYRTYIMAALILLKKWDITFLCVGAGNNLQYKKMIPQKYRTNILFFEAQKDVLSVMNVCDIGVLATYTEGISNAIMEFMALGKPVVATDGGGTKELIMDGVTGYLVNRKSETELAEKISFIYNNKCLRNKMSEEGIKRIQKKFSITSMIHSFIKVYEDLLNK